MTTAWPRRIVVVASVVALVWAVWSMTGERSNPPASPRAAPTREGSRAASVARPDTTPAREASSAADVVLGWVVTPEGAAVEAGAVVFACEATGRPLRDTARLGPGGTFEARGCGGRVCAQLQHPSLIQRDAWELEPGLETELVARPLARLRGVVVDAHGAPVPGAAVVAAPDDEDPTALPPFVSSAVSTDAEGEFAFVGVEMPPCDACGRRAGRCSGEPALDRIYRGPVTLVARAEGYRSSALAVAVPDDVGGAALRLVLGDPVPTGGTVRGADGHAFARLHVLARHDERTHDVHSAWADPDGRFSLPGLGDGTYSLRFVQDGAEIGSFAGVEAGAEIDVEIDAEADGVEVHVEVRSRGAPLAGAIVDGGPFRGATTDENGRVSALRVLPGRYALRVRSGGGSARADLTVGHEPTSLAVDVERSGP